MSIPIIIAFFLIKDNPMIPDYKKNKSFLNPINHEKIKAKTEAKAENDGV